MYAIRSYYALGLSSRIDCSDITATTATEAAMATPVADFSSDRTTVPPTRNGGISPMAAWMRV